jgi:hypothetical protein
MINKIFKTIQKLVKKNSLVVAPINKMVKPYTMQQFFDQPANIMNGQLLAMNHLIDQFTFFPVFHNLSIQSIVLSLT